MTHDDTDPMAAIHAEMEKLSDRERDYVRARAIMPSARQAYMQAGISETTFYRRSPEHRAYLNQLADSIRQIRMDEALSRIDRAIPEAVKVLVRQLDSQKENIAQAAAIHLLDRILGKPGQPYSVTKPEQPFTPDLTRLSEEDLETFKVLVDKLGLKEDTGGDSVAH